MGSAPNHGNPQREVEKHEQIEAFLECRLSMMECAWCLHHPGRPTSKLVSSMYVILVHSLHDLRCFFFGRCLPYFSTVVLRRIPFRRSPAACWAALSLFGLTPRAPNDTPHDAMAFSENGNYVEPNELAVRHGVCGWVLLAEVVVSSGVGGRCSSSCRIRSKRIYVRPRITEGRPDVGGPAGQDNIFLTATLGTLLLAPPPPHRMLQHRSECVLCAASNLPSSSSSSSSSSVRRVLPCASPQNFNVCFPPPPPPRRPRDDALFFLQRPP